MRQGGGVAIGAAMAAFAFLLFLPFLLVVFLYLFFTIYGMTKGTDLHASTINLSLWFSGLVVVTAALVVLMAAAVSIIGKSLTPPKRRKRDRDRDRLSRPRGPPRPLPRGSSGSRRA